MATVLHFYLPPSIWTWLTVAGIACASLRWKNSCPYLKIALCFQGSYQLEEGLDDSCLGKEAMIECRCFLSKAQVVRVEYHHSDKALKRSTFVSVGSSAKCPLMVLSCGQTKSRPGRKARGQLLRLLGKLLSQQRNRWAVKTPRDVSGIGAATQPWRAFASWTICQGMILLPGSRGSWCWGQGQYALPMLPITVEFWFSWQCGYKLGPFLSDVSGPGLSLESWRECVGPEFLTLLNWSLHWGRTRKTKVAFLSLWSLPYDVGSSLWSLSHFLYMEQLVAWAIVSSRRRGMLLPALNPLGSHLVSLWPQLWPGD